MTSKTPPLRCGPEGNLRLALCQIETKPWDLDRNLERTLAALERAADEGAELAVTPECVLSGYPPMHNASSRERTTRAALTLESPAVRAVADLAARRRMAITLGFAELDATTGLIHNSAVTFGTDGKPLSVYRKVHCRSFEDAAREGLFTPGEDFVVTEVKETAAQCAGGPPFRIGTMICFDREIPESLRCLRAMGAQLVVCPLATNTSRLDRAEGDQADNEMVTRCRAAENELFIAVVNHAGSFNGGSFVVGPGGETLVQLGVEAEVRVVEIPLGATHQFHSNPLGWMGWGYRRPEVYKKHLA